MASTEQQRITVQQKISSPIGPLYLVASDKGLQGVFRQRQNIPTTTAKEKSAAEKILARATQQLQEYFAGRRKSFDLPFDVQGTPFQRSVWEQLQKIPYGETCSYQDIARRIKNQKAVRAVGNANGKNPLSVIVPCHRVIATDGSLGGYGGGLPMKKQLLQLEKQAAG